MDTEISELFKDISISTQNVFIYTFPVCVHIYSLGIWNTCVSIHTYVSLLSQLRRPRSNNIPVATSTLKTQILISNTPFQ